MMYAPLMFPKSFHPGSPSMLPDFSGIVKPRRRKWTRGIKYIFIDFGHSYAFESFEKRELVMGARCQDITVPEIPKSLEYDGFKVDLYTLGNLYKNTFIKARLLFCASIIVLLLKRLMVVDRNTLICLSFHPLRMP